MNQKMICILSSPLALLLLVAPAVAQTAPNQAAPVSYASMNQLSGMLSQLEQASQATQADLAKLRIPHWKTDENMKRQSGANVDSIQRNLHDALPGMIAELRGSPENLASTFKLYRNLDALYDVLGSVVESAGAFGSRNEFRPLVDDLGAIEKSRHSFGDRMEVLAGEKETELTHLRAQIVHAQAAMSAPPKKVIVDDAEPAPKKKKVVHKKPTAKKPE